MKVRVKALKRGTVVSPSTGQQVHFDPKAKRYPLAKTPFVDTRDVEEFVTAGWCEKPKDNAREYGLEQEREIIHKEGRGAERRAGSGKSPVDAQRAAGRVAAAAAADRAGGPANSGLDTRQVRNHAPGDGPDQDIGGDGDEGGEGDGGLGAGDPAAPPAGGAARRGGRQARSAAPKGDQGKKDG